MSDYFDMAKSLLDKHPLPSRKHIKKVFQCQAFKAANDYLYAKCMKPANYPVPAIPLKVQLNDPYGQFGYCDMIHIDALNTGEDDPVMVCCWDFYWFTVGGSTNRGKYTVMGNAHAS